MIGDHLLDEQEGVKLQMCKSRPLNQPVPLVTPAMGQSLIMHVYVARENQMALLDRQQMGPHAESHFFSSATFECLVGIKPLGLFGRPGDPMATGTHFHA